MSQPIGRPMFNMLGAVAQFERELMLAGGGNRSGQIGR
jgi:DNA invertase Pin-like site-specific DNA recombinase